jgi:hypothetical protein
MHDDFQLRAPNEVNLHAQSLPDGGPQLGKCRVVDTGLALRRQEHLAGEAVVSEPPEAGGARQHAEGQESIIRRCCRGGHPGAGRCPHPVNPLQQSPSHVSIGRGTPAMTKLSGETAGLGDVPADGAAQLQQTIVGKVAATTARACLTGPGSAAGAGTVRSTRAERASRLFRASAGVRWAGPFLDHAVCDRSSLGSLFSM